MTVTTTDLSCTGKPCKERRHGTVGRISQPGEHAVTADSSGMTSPSHAPGEIGLLEDVFPQIFVFDDAHESLSHTRRVKADLLVRQLWEIEKHVLQ